VLIPRACHLREFASDEPGGVLHMQIPAYLLQDPFDRREVLAQRGVHKAGRTSAEVERRPGRGKKCSLAVAGTECSKLPLNLVRGKNVVSIQFLYIVPRAGPVCIVDCGAQSSIVGRDQLYLRAKAPDDLGGPIR